MRAIQFAQFHGREISVEIRCGDESRVVRGIAKCQRDEGFGASLAIQIREPEGDFEFLLDESEFTGAIVRSTADGYYLLLESSCQCVG